jgi:hypothetical protein
MLCVHLWMQDIEPLLDSQGNPVTDSRGNPIPKVLPAAAGLLAYHTLGHDIPGYSSIDW